MGEILVLKSNNGRLLTDRLVDSWLDANEMFIIKKIFSNDRYSVEITFIDEERADMMSDLLSTCYGDFISVGRPQTAMSTLNDSFDEERVPSPVHLSSASSISSKISCFSQRLLALDKKRNDNIVKIPVNRESVIDTGSSNIDMLIAKDVNDDDDDGSLTNSNATSPVPSLVNSTISSRFGRGRGATFK